MSRKPSGFIWYELLTSDIAAAAAFYGKVLGWKTRASGVPGMDYRLLAMGAVDVGGLMAVPAEAAANGMRPAWLSYINVADVDASVAAIGTAGGTVHMPPADIPGIGRFAMVADPQGASFYVMTPIGETAPSPSFRPGVPGHGGWHELHTRDWKAALKFYGGQFGWGTAQAMDMGPAGTYLMFNTGSGDAIGGIMDDRETARPHWLIYFNVDDIDAAKARVKTAGGEVLAEPHEVPGGSWIIRARDAQGAAFALVGPRKA